MVVHAEILHTKLDFLFLEVLWDGGRNAGCGPRRYNLQIQLRPMLAVQPQTPFLTSLCLSFLDEAGIPAHLLLRTAIRTE